MATPLFDVDGGDIAVARLDDDVAGCTLQVGKNRTGSSALASDEGSIVLPEKVDIAFAIANHHVLTRRQRTPGATACKQVLFPGACTTGNVERTTAVNSRRKRISRGGIVTRRCRLLSCLAYAASAWVIFRSRDGLAKSIGQDPIWDFGGLARRIMSRPI